MEGVASIHAIEILMVPVYITAYMVGLAGLEGLREAEGNRLNWSVKKRVMVGASLVAMATVVTFAMF